MSIQPNRVIARIIEQVDRSDWPRLASQTFFSADGGETLRFFRAPASERHATPIHFWVHALRDELAACGRRDDLVAAAGHALCRNQPLDAWIEEVGALRLACGRSAAEALALAEALEAKKATAVEVYRMLESDCRRSSVCSDGAWLMAHFWGHGAPESWRREVRR